eukprot:1145624-Pelagomonas_calceolata.AAC.2
MRGATGAHKDPVSGLLPKSAASCYCLSCAKNFGHSWPKCNHVSVSHLHEQTRRVSKEMGIPGTLKFLWKTEGLGGLFRQVLAGFQGGALACNVDLPGWTHSSVPDVKAYQSDGAIFVFSPHSRGNTASVLRIMPYAAIHFSVYEHYRRIIKELILREEHKQQHQQGHGSSHGKAGDTGSKEQEAAAAVARVLGPQQSQAVKSIEPSGRRTAEERAQAVAAVLDRVMEESSSSGSSIDVTAAMVAAEAQVLVLV